MKRTEDKLVTAVHQVAYHRNGIGGAGFHAVLFDTPYEVCSNCKGHDSAGWTNAATGAPAPCPHCKGTTFETSSIRMLAMVFDEPGHVAVVDVAKLSDPAVGVAFGVNSWRGDQFEPELRAAIVATESDGSVRVGPFAIPTKRRSPQ